MPIVNVNLDLPPAPAAGIAADKLYREGSVVRDAVTKQIVKHLKEADGETSTDAAARAVAAARVNPAVAAGMAVAAVGAVTAVTIVSHKKRFPKATLQRFESAFRSYIEETRAGKISVAVIDELDSAWSATQMLPPSLSDAVRTSPIFLATKQTIAEYTQDFARANGAELPVKFTTEAHVLDLSDYLTEQCRILTEAA